MSHEEKDDRVESTANQNSAARAANFVESAAGAINTSRDATRKSEEKRSALYEEFGEQAVQGWIGEHQALLEAGVLGDAGAGAAGAEVAAGDDAGSDAFDMHGERVLRIEEDVSLPTELPWPAEGNCFELVVRDTSSWDLAVPLGLALTPSSTSSTATAESEQTQKLCAARADDVDTPELEVSFGADASIRMAVPDELTLRVEVRGADHDMVGCVPSSYMTRLVGRQSASGLWTANNEPHMTIRLFGPPDVRVSWRVLELSAARISWQPSSNSV